MSRSNHAGTFKPGNRANPGGRPKRTPEEFELIAACRTKTPEALATIEEIMRDGDSAKVRLQAALAIIERAHGRATEHKEIRTGPLDSVGPDELIAAHEMVKEAIAKAKATT